MTELYHLRGKIFPFEDEFVDVWIDDGRIVFEEPPLKSEQVSTEPLFLMPGFVDAHTHLTMDKNNFGNLDIDVDFIRGEMDKYLDAGVLLLRDTGQIRNINHEIMNQNHPVILQSAGKFLFSEGGYLDYVEPTSPEEVLDQVKLQVDLGYNWIKIIGDWPRSNQEGAMNPVNNYEDEVVHAIVKAAHRLGARIAVHTMGEDMARLAVEAGVDTIEHGNSLTNELLEEMADKRIAWTPTLIAFETFRDQMPERVDALFKGIGPKMSYATELEIDILVGTDVIPSGQVYKEVEMLHKWGLSIEDCLAAATTTPHKFLGGSKITDGAIANIVGFVENPLKDLRVIRKPDVIIGKGKLHR